MNRLFDLYRRRDFSDFEGFRINARIPISEAILNEIVQEAVSTRGDNIEHIRMSIRGENTINVDLRVKWGFIAKTFKFDTVVQRELNFPTSPKLIVTLSGSGMPLGILTRIADSIFGVLPKSISFVGRSIEVDLENILGERQLEYLIPYVRSAYVETSPRVLILLLEAEINQTDNTVSDAS